MHQTKKGKQWYFGMKAHIGVDAGSGLAHSLTTTAANASDVTQAGTLLHGGETTAWGDAGYQGVEKRPEHRDGGVEWRVAMKPGRRRLLGEGVAEEAAETRKGSVRAKVEHPFLYVKRHFGYAKVRYRGVAKNRQRIALLLGVLEPADRRPLRDGMTRGQSARRWRDDGEGGGYRPFGSPPTTKTAPSPSGTSPNFKSKLPLPLEASETGLFRLSLERNPTLRDQYGPNVCNRKHR